MCMKPGVQIRHEQDDSGCQYVTIPLNQRFDLDSAISGTGTVARTMQAGDITVDGMKVMELEPQKCEDISLENLFDPDTIEEMRIYAEECAALAQVEASYGTGTAQQKLYELERKAEGEIKMNNDAMMNRAKQLVVDYFNKHVEVTDGKKLTIEDVFIVWFSKTLQNWKALVSTTVSDGMYYEITHNGDKGETYIDAYKKWDNICVADGDTVH